MTSREPRGLRFTIIAAILFVAMMMGLVLWSSSVFRNGIVVLGAPR
jgi:hypothetical protein